MSEAGFTIAVTFPRRPEVIFSSLQDVSKWWGGEDFAGNSVKKGDEFTVIHGDVHFSKQQLIDVIPEKRIVWLVTESRLSWLTGNKHEWTDTKMVFDLMAAGGETVLRFTHEGLVPSLECYEKCTEGWTMVISKWLPDYVNFGKTI